MINEQFINACFSVVINKYSMFKNKNTYNDLKYIIESYKKETEKIENWKEYPLYVVNKVRLFTNINDSLLKGNTLDDSLGKINWDGIFKELKDFIHFKINEEINDEEFIKISQRISVPRESVVLMEHTVELEKVLNKFQDNNFEDIEVMNEEYIKFITGFYEKIKQAKRAKMLNDVSSYFVSEGFEDTLDPMLNNFQLKNDPNNSIPTGYDILDTDILNGGFVKGSLYIIGGFVKSGKSTMMNNMLMNALQVDYHTRDSYDGKHKIFIHISMENEPDEGFTRNYCKVFNMTVDELKEWDLKDREGFKKALVEVATSHNNSLQSGYKVDNSFTVNDIFAYVENVLELYKSKNKDKECCIGGLYIDYINLIKTEGKKDLRLNLGDTARELKNLAIELDIPVITATQLNRSTAVVKKSGDLSIGQVGESHMLSTIADGMFLMTRDPDNEDIVYFSSGAQRRGKSHCAVDFKVNFEKFDFISCDYSNKTESRPVDGVLKTVDDAPKTKKFDGFNFGSDGY